MTRISREQKTIQAMIRIYCNAKHNSDEKVCPDCKNLLKYANQRLEKCPFGEEKPTCNHCPIHCYKSDRKIEMKKVMRFSGPRMIWHHPILAIKHILDEKSNKHNQQ